MQTPRGRAQPHKTAPLESPTARNTSRSPTASSDLATNQGCPRPPPPFQHLLGQLAELRGHRLTFPGLSIKGLIKEGAGEELEEEINRGRSEGARAQELLSWNGAAFTKTEVLGTLYFRDFYGAFVIQAWSIINSVSSPSPLPGRWWMGLKLQASNHGRCFW